MIDKPLTILISPRSILIAILLGIGVFLTLQLLPIIGLVFVSIILASALHPLVQKLHRHRIPKTVGILIIYTIILLLLTLTVSLIIPPLIFQTTLLSEQLPAHLPIVVKQLDTLSIDLSFLIQQFVGVPKDVISLIFSLFSNLIGVVSLIVMTFFMLLEFEDIEAKLPNWFSSYGKKNITQFVHKLEHQLGGWVRGQLVLMFIVGFLSYIGLSILGVPFALPLAMLAGLLELIPNLGPIIASVPALLVALLISPIHALAVLLLYFLIQQLENNVIVPKVMEKAVGVNPLVGLITLMAGFKLGGIIGTILSIPILVTVQIFVSQFLLPHLHPHPKKSK